MHDEVLRHADWIHKLAHDLTRDRDEADDVAQETLLRAVQHPPPAGLNERRLRAWLRTVVRNLVVRNFRVRPPGAARGSPPPREAGGDRPRRAARPHRRAA